MRMTWHKSLNGRGRWQGALVAAALMAVPFAAQAAVPSTMSIEGSLYSSGGGAAADGNYNIVFSVYKDAVGGNPVFAEGPVVVSVKNGLFSYVIGTKTPLTATALANLPTAFLGMKIESDPELTRQQLSSAPYALRAAIAEGVECSGCITAGNLDPNVLGAYAKSSTLSKVATSGAYADLTGSPTLAKVATSGAFADLTGGPDLSAYAKLANLAKVASSGAYADLTGAPDLTAYAKATDLGAYTKTAGLAKVALTGQYADLAGEPTVTLAFGSSCGTGLAVKGIKSDGTLDCVAAGSGPVEPKNLPADGIDEISNKLIYNQFVDSAAGGTNIGIPDNNPVGVSDVITFPDIGIAQKLTITIDISNSDVSHLNVSVFDPNNVEYILYSSGSTGATLVTSYPDPTAPVKGDLTTWVGKNPAGKWFIKVVDTAFKNNTTDGAINKWSINLSTLSSKKIAIAGNLIVAGDTTASGNLAVGGALTVNGFPTWTYRQGSCNGYDNNYGWQNANDATYCLGINPSTWSNGAVAASINPDKDLWRMTFQHGGRNKIGGIVVDKLFTQYSDTNMSQHEFILFRIKNSTGATINWAPTYYYTCGGNWSDYSSASINGANTWSASGACYLGNCTANPTFAVPGNRVSSVVFAISSSVGWAPAGFYHRELQLAFVKGSLKLPAGLEFIDDLDTATGGWEQ
jgi:subtilisin-like proprotein convertase family protein